MLKSPTVTVQPTMPSLDYDNFTVDSRRGWIGTWHTHKNYQSLVPVEDSFKTQRLDETRCFIGAALTRRTYQEVVSMA
ncbi:hypothetical protein AN958_00090 [Leucoagaricus sp. SymC.cos]|nr:hypothetical protein AN958_00090 [Leucoagaricus sp. SymC.cos]